MTPFELRASCGLASIYALRMFGMFLVLPVLSLYASTLPGAHDPTWIGLALGSYGLSQALLQLPLGMLSDRIGRKSVIYLGLALLACGSFVAANAHSIEILTLGRIIQGTGAISAAITALLADLTREEVRTQAMAIIGSSIAISFAFSLVASPLLAHWLGVPGLFMLTAGLSLVGILAVKWLIPDPAVSRFHSDAETNTRRLISIVRDPQLARLTFGIFTLHAAQMALFVILPLTLVTVGQLDKAHHWYVYLPTVIAGFVFMVPAIIYGETRHRLKFVFVAAIALMATTQLGMAWTLSSLTQIITWLTTYFIAFNILEATLPSLISKIAPAASRGTAMGVYNTAQSLGLFLGGVAGGWLYTKFGTLGVFAFTSVLMLSWLGLAATMKAPAAVKSLIYALGPDWQGDPLQLSQQLAALEGVYEAVVLANERVAYLKVLQAHSDEASIQQLIQETYAWRPSTK